MANKENIGECPPPKKKHRLSHDEDTYYEYVEYVSKNNQHRFRDIHSKNKSVKAYAVVTSPRCVVKILDYYYKKSSTGT